MSSILTFPTHDKLKSEERAMYEYTDHLGRCERLGEIVPEAELISIVADNDVELLVCPSCAAEIDE